jgi:tRNA pseudouridine55 synthase
MKGFINLIKPSGMSSARAVTAVKKKFNCPCGHMGTLDPMASGVLPVGIGKASRLFQYMLDKDKIYIARFKFGLVTDTLDTTGETLSTTDYIPTEEEIKESTNALKRLNAEIDIVESFELPGTDMKRNIVVVKKLSKTDNVFPRKAGTPSKKPL